MKEYKNVGDHVQDLAGGQMVGIGDVVELDEEGETDPHNARLIELGTFIQVSAVEEPKKKSSAKAKEGDKE